MDWFEKVKSFSKLEQGWDSYKAPPINEIAITNAVAYLEQCSSCCPNRVEPWVGGGIGISYYNGERKAYIEFYNNGTAYALFSDRENGDMETKKIEINKEAYQDFIKKAQEFLLAK